MNMQSSTQCTTDDRLRAFVEERLQPQDEAIVAEHIGVCDACRNRMEALAGDGAAWDEVRLQLQSADDSITGSQAEREGELQVLVDCLDPTDDPTKVPGSLQQAFNQER